MSSLSDALLSLAGGAATQYNKNTEQERKVNARKAEIERRAQIQQDQMVKQSDLRKKEFDYTSAFQALESSKARSFQGEQQATRLKVQQEEGRLGRALTRSEGKAGREQQATLQGERISSQESIATAKAEAALAAAKAKHAARIKESQTLLLNQREIALADTEYNNTVKAQSKAEIANARFEAYREQGDTIGMQMTIAKFYGEEKELASAINKGITIPRYNKPIPLKEINRPKIIAKPDGSMEISDPSHPAAKIEVRRALRDAGQPTVSGAKSTETGAGMDKVEDPDRLSDMERLQAMLSPDGKKNLIRIKSESRDPQTGAGVTKELFGKMVDGKFVQTDEVIVGPSKTAIKGMKYDMKSSNAYRGNDRNYEYSMRTLEAFGNLATAARSGVPGAIATAVSTVKANLIGAATYLGAADEESLNSLIRQNLATAKVDTDGLIEDTRDWEFMKGMTDNMRLQAIYAFAGALKESTKERITNADVDMAKDFLTGSGGEANTAGRLEAAKNGLRLRRSIAARDAYRNTSFDPETRQQGGERWLAMQRNDKGSAIFQRNENYILAEKDAADGSFKAGEIVVKFQNKEGTEIGVPLNDYMMSIENKRFGGQGTNY